MCNEDRVDSGKEVLVMCPVACPVELIAVPFRVELKCPGDSAKLDATVAEPKTQLMKRFDVIITDGACTRPGAMASTRCWTLKETR